MKLKIKYIKYTYILDEKSLILMYKYIFKKDNYKMQYEKLFINKIYRNKKRVLANKYKLIKSI